jgi:hypothetical protein
VLIHKLIVIIFLHFFIALAINCLLVPNLVFFRPPLNFLLQLFLIDLYLHLIKSVEMTLRPNIVGVTAENQTDDSHQTTPRISPLS